MGFPIRAEPVRPYKTAVAWATKRGAPKWFAELAEIYWFIGSNVGVFPEGAFAQACKETGFGNFGGAVDVTFNNYCGLKTRTASGDRPEDHQRFTTPLDGILAQYHHLNYYAGFDHTPSLDPREFSSIFGKCQTFRSLSKNWAGAGYGESLEDLYISSLLAY